MTDRPILFNGDMVRAILDGRKTQTRRPVKPQPKHDGVFWNIRGAYWGGQSMPVMPGHSLAKASAFGVPGDRLYVRETFLHACSTHLSQAGTFESNFGGRVEYVADGAKPRRLNPGAYGSPYMRKRPSIHMPKWAARIWLRVDRVWVERVQDISHRDALAEGVSYDVSKRDGAPVPRFHALWRSIYGDDLSVWVWACEFTVLSTTGEP